MRGDSGRHHQSPLFAWWMSSRDSQAFTGPLPPPLAFSGPSAPISAFSSGNRDVGFVAVPRRAGAVSYAGSPAFSGQVGPPAAVEPNPGGPSDIISGTEHVFSVQGPSTSPELPAAAPAPPHSSTGTPIDDLDQLFDDMESVGDLLPTEGRVSAPTAAPLLSGAWAPSEDVLDRTAQSSSASTVVDVEPSVYTSKVINADALPAPAAAEQQVSARACDPVQYASYYDSGILLV